MPLPLEKEQEKVKLALHKRDIPPVLKINVKLFADVSGSFRDEFTVPRKGKYVVDPFFTAALAIAGVVDPDQNIQVIAFSDRALDTGDYALSDADNIREAFLKRANPVLWGSTNYAAALDVLLSSDSMKSKLGGLLGGLFGFGKKTPPANTKKEAFLVLFVSDGEDMGSDKDFIAHLNSLSKMGTFVVLIGANSDNSVNFKTMIKAAEVVEGCTFHRLTDLASLSTDALYERIFDTEFKRWFDTLPAEYKS